MGNARELYIREHYVIRNLRKISSHEILKYTVHVLLHRSTFT